MSLTIHHKSIYLIILNATMILRSVGKNIKTSKTLRDFKIRIFEILSSLFEKMDKGKLKEKDIFNSIKELKNEFSISFGQAQKPINVLLKYHFYLTRNNNDKQKKELYCPIDSVILNELKWGKISLTKINEVNFKKLQDEIHLQSPIRL